MIGDWGEDDSKFKKYIKEIYDNDTWLIHKKQLDRQKTVSDDEMGHGVEEVEKGQLYLMKHNPDDYGGDTMYYYYYAPTSLDEEKYGREVGFLIYLPTEQFKKRYSQMTDYEIYYEKITSILNYSEALTKISLRHQLINWNILPWGGVK